MTYHKLLPISAQRILVKGAEIKEVNAAIYLVMILNPHYFKPNALRDFVLLNGSFYTYDFTRLY